MTTPTTKAGRALVYEWGPTFAEAILAIEAEAVAAERARLADAVRTAQGYVNGTTIDGEDVWSGLEPSDGAGMWQGEWLQKAAVLRLIEPEP